MGTLGLPAAKKCVLCQHPAKHLHVLQKAIHQRIPFSLCCEQWEARIGLLPEKQRPTNALLEGKGRKEKWSWSNNHWEPMIGHVLALSKLNAVFICRYKRAHFLTPLKWLPDKPHFWSWSEPSITTLPWTLFHTTPGRRQSSWSAQTLQVITGHKNQCKI